MRLDLEEIKQLRVLEFDRRSSVVLTLVDGSRSVKQVIRHLPDGSSKTVSSHVVRAVLAVAQAQGLIRAVHMNEEVG